MSKPEDCKRQTEILDAAVKQFAQPEAGMSAREWRRKLKVGDAIHIVGNEEKHESDIMDEYAESLTRPLVERIAELERLKAEVEELKVLVREVKR